MRILLLSFLAMFSAITLAQADEHYPAFSEDEKTRILSHSPWPPEMTIDPSNRYSGNKDTIAYGKILFDEMKLSKDAVLSCASCHQPDRNFMDGVPLNRGHDLLVRHTPSLVNVGQQRWFGWGSGNDTLWAQSIRPILTVSEMRMTPAEVKEVISSNPRVIPISGVWRFERKRRI